MASSKTKIQQLREILGENVFLAGPGMGKPQEGSLVFGYRENDGRLVVVPEENISGLQGTYTLGYYFLSHEGSQKDRRVFRKDVYKIENPRNLIGDSLIKIRRDRYAPLEPLRSEDLADAALEALAEQRGRSPDEFCK